VASAAETAGSTSDPSATAAAQATPVSATAIGDGAGICAEPARTAASSSPSVAPQAQGDQECGATIQRIAVAAHAAAARIRFLHPAPAQAMPIPAALPATASGSMPKAPSAAPPAADHSAARWNPG